MGSVSAVMELLEIPLNFLKKAKTFLFVSSSLNLIAFQTLPRHTHLLVLKPYHFHADTCLYGFSCLKQTLKLEHHTGKLVIKIKGLHKVILFS